MRKNACQPAQFEDGQNGQRDKEMPAERFKVCATCCSSSREKIGARVHREAALEAPVSNQPDASSPLLDMFGFEGPHSRSTSTGEV